jgi:hypothetical protein
MFPHRSTLRLRSLAFVLFAAVLPAAAQINPGFNPSTPIRVVYRVETAAPLGTFISGFNARGPDQNLLSLTSGAPCNLANPLQGAGWVVMTADRGQAVRFAQRTLEGMPSGGSNRRAYIYSIRADGDFISVPGAFYSAIDAGREGRAGYTGAQANALEYLLFTRPILGEQMVVATNVRTRNIIAATSLWIEGGDLVESGVPTENYGYIHDASTAASNVVSDWNLPALFPHGAILSSEAGASGSCAMSCDRATSASSFSASAEIDYASQCGVSDAVAPLLFDIIND